MGRTGAGAGKKLRRLAKRWAGGRTRSRGGGEESLEDQLKAVGAEIPEGLELPTSDQDDDVEIWPDMQPAVSLFFGCATQWRWTGSGMAGALRTGLDYSSLPVVAGAMQVQVTPEVLNDLRTMETEAMAAWARK